jgi:hypothetical protein
MFAVCTTRCNLSEILHSTNSAFMCFILISEQTEITPISFFTPVCFTPFSFNAPCKFTPLHNMRSLIFSLTPFGWLRSVTLTRYYDLNISFGLRPLFQECN